jgi:UDP-glucose:(heptosyl)LPS alpha-1,3-glucosyltransferase
LNIGLVIERMDPGLGGAEQWTYQFARWLLAQGHEVHVIAAAVADSVKRLGVVAHELGAARRRVRFAAEAERAARSLPLDIVHDMGRGWSCDVFHPHNGSRSAAFEHNLLAEPNWKRPWKRAGHALLPRYRDFDRLMARQYVADGRLYVAVSRMVAEHFRTFHGVCESRIRRIYNGVDVRRFSPDRRVEFREPTRRRLGVRDDELLLLIVAHNPRLKGVPAVIRACAELGRRGVPARLAVVGGRPLWSHQRLARRLGVANRVAFIGAVNDPVHLYMAADVYVQPTFYDPCSLVVLEAMACGLPVVTTRHNGVSELMTSGVDGQLINDPRDWRELAACLEFLRDEAVRRPIGLAARRLAEAHPLERNFREVMAVYREIGSNPGRIPAQPYRAVPLEVPLPRLTGAN